MAFGTGFAPITLVFSVSIIPPMLRTHLNLLVALSEKYYHFFFIFKVLSR